MFICSHVKDQEARNKKVQLIGECSGFTSVTDFISSLDTDKYKTTCVQKL